VRRALASLAARGCEVRVPELAARLVCLRSDVPRMEQAVPGDDPVVNLLPPLDPYLMGYQERSRYLDPDDRPYVFDRSGNATSTILVDGRVAGVWDSEEGNPPALKLYPLRTLGRGAWERVQAEGRDVGRFIHGQDVVLRVCDSMVPLTERPTGRMLSPLKGCP
jgi:hypothetical protein